MRRGFPQRIHVIDREACWKSSGLLCLPQTLAVGSPDSVFNTGLENQRIRITQDIFTGMNVSRKLSFFLLLSPLCLNLYNIFPSFSFLLPLVLFLFLAQLLSVPVILDFGLESDFLWLSLSYNVSHWEPRTKHHGLMETRCLTPSFPEAFKNHSL